MQKSYDPSCLYYAVPQVPHPLTPTLVTAPSTTSLFQPPLQPFPVKDHVSVTEMFPNVAHPGNVGLKIDVAEDKDQKNSSYLVCVTIPPAVVMCAFCFVCMDTCVCMYLCGHVYQYMHICACTPKPISVCRLKFLSVFTLCSG